MPIRPWRRDALVEGDGTRQPANGLSRARPRPRPRSRSSGSPQVAVVDLPLQELPVERAAVDAEHFGGLPLVATHQPQHLEDVILLDRLQAPEGGWRRGWTQ